VVYKSVWTCTVGKVLAMLWHCRRRWVICQWRCWRQYWWGRSCCCIRLTLKVTMISVHTSLASPVFLNVELSLSWPQWARTGVSHSLDGHSRLLLSGSDTSWRSWLNVSIEWCVISVRTMLIVLDDTSGCSVGYYQNIRLVVNKYIFSPLYHAADCQSVLSVSLVQLL